MSYIQDYEINAALQKMERAIERRIEKHGQQPHQSAHESLGICQGGESAVSPEFNQQNGE